MPGSRADGGAASHAGAWTASPPPAHGEGMGPSILTGRAAGEGAAPCAVRIPGAGFAVMHRSSRRQVKPLRLTDVRVLVGTSLVLVPVPVPRRSNSRHGADNRERSTISLSARTRSADPWHEQDRVQARAGSTASEMKTPDRERSGMRVWWRSLALGGTDLPHSCGVRRIAFDLLVIAGNNRVSR